jgi:hypothetical protein
MTTFVVAFAVFLMGLFIIAFAVAYPILLRKIGSFMTDSHSYSYHSEYVDFDSDSWCNFCGQAWPCSGVSTVSAIAEDERQEADNYHYGIEALNEAIQRLGFKAVINFTIDSMMQTKLNIPDESIPF